MKKISSNFKERLRTGGRELDINLSFLDNDFFYDIRTEDNKDLLAENNIVLRTESAINVLDEDSIRSVSINSYAQFGKTIMKYVEIDSRKNTEKGKIDNVKIGLKVNNEFEYIDYGNYQVKDSSYQMDTKSYSIIACDKMLKSMIKYDEDPLKIEYPIAHRDLVIAICNKLHFKYVLPKYYPNSNKKINDIYYGNDMTYRDILDDLNTVIGSGCFTFTLDDIFTIKFVNSRFKNTTLLPFKIGNDVILNQNIDNNNGDNIVNDYDLMTNNVDVSRKIGKINQVVYIDKDNVTRILGQDNNSIALNGLNTYEIKDCKILDKDFAGEYNKELFEALNGLEYYVCDLQTKGVLNLELLDNYTLEHNGNFYNCIMLNDEIEITDGLNEHLYTDDTEENRQEYVVSTASSKSIKDAVIQTNKNAGTIVLKVTSDNKMAQVRLDASADEGTEFKVDADNIDFKSHTFNLATDNISIVSDNVSITDNGIQLSNGAVIAGENGLITNLQFVSDGKFENYSLLGINTSSFAPGGFDKSYADVSVEVDIPDNFVIKSAYITLYHTPIYWYYYDEQAGNSTYIWGSSKDIALYKANNQNINYTFEMATASEYKATLDNSNITLIQNLGSPGNTSGNSIVKIKSSDIKNYLPSGQKTKLILRTSRSILSDEKSCLEITGASRAVVDIIGFTAYTR